MSQTIEFRSKFSRHTLTRIPRVEGFSATGQRTVVQQGERIVFEPVSDGKGGLEGKYVARVGKNVHTDSIDWLKDGEDDAAERDEVDALKAHRVFGKDVWVLGWSPQETRQLPQAQDFRRDVVRASAKLDAETVQALLDQELATHGRGDLVTFAQESLATIAEERAALEAEAPEEE